MKILITGFAGFIGFHAAREFLRRGGEVVGIDNFNDYYSVKLKRDRAAVLEALPGFSARELDICDLEGLRGAFAAENAFIRVDPGQRAVKLDGFGLALLYAQAAADAAG
jgi:UDP-glucuronate 4-epimerase